MRMDVMFQKDDALNSPPMMGNCGFQSLPTGTSGVLLSTMEDWVLLLFDQCDVVSVTVHAMQWMLWNRTHEMV